MTTFSELDTRETGRIDIGDDIPAPPGWTGDSIEREAALLQEYAKTHKQRKLNGACRVAVASPSGPVMNELIEAKWNRGPHPQPTARPQPNLTSNHNPTPYPTLTEGHYKHQTHFT